MAEGVGGRSLGLFVFICVHTQILLAIILRICVAFNTL